MYSIVTGISIDLYFLKFLYFILRTSMLYQPLNENVTCVVKALWNALRGRHKYGATNGNQYAARRCSMITRLTRDSLTLVRVRWGAAIFAHYTCIVFTARTVLTVHGIEYVYIGTLGTKFLYIRTHIP